MMMMPSIFGGNLFNDDWMDFSFPDIDKELYGKHAKNLMKTDVKEKFNKRMLRINDVKTVGQAVNLLNQISQIDLGNEK